VTGAPKVFLANVKGAWLYPDAMPVERLVDIAHACPSGAIQYHRKDGQPDEAPPPVNLLSVREAGPYGLRGELVLRGQAIGTRATLCRCGASKNKPFCDGSHHDIHFDASGEPETGLLGLPTEMPVTRDGRIDIEPEPNGPLQLRGPVEVLSGTGRMVCRVAQARLCRCGGSATKPFCDGTHARNGFSAD
jgi:CDGSH-type Zn-finger protein